MSGNGSRAGLPSRLGYLSAAPTVSTRKAARSAGPRAHILGVLSGFEAAGFETRRFIVGDRMAAALAKSRVQGLLEASPLARYAGDLARLVMGYRNAQKAYADIQGSADWVYERFATMQVLGRRFQRAGIPWILETQGLFYYETQTERQNVGWASLAKRIEIRAYRDCDVLICISEPLKELLIGQCGIDPSKILVVPNAVDLDRFDPSCRIRDPNAPPTLVFAGGLIQWQALDLLLAAMAELRQAGQIINLRIVGDGVMLQPWQDLAKTLGLGDQVVFAGHVDGDRVAAEIARGDIGYAGARTMAIGSMYHSPIKLYEYMAMARPVLAAAHDDARRLIEGQDTGWLYRPDDKDDLKRALRQAVADRDQWASRGNRARSLIEQRHSWRARTAMMIKQLDAKLMAGTGRVVPLGLDHVKTGAS